MLAWMRGSGTHGAVSRLWAKRGFSPSLSPGAWEPADLQAGGPSGEQLSTSSSAALQETSSTDQETLGKTGISAGFCLCEGRKIPRGLAEATSALETRLLPY